jgi:hypothetical protein
MAPSTAFHPEKRVDTDPDNTTVVKFPTAQTPLDPNLLHGIPLQSRSPLIGTIEEQREWIERALKNPTLRKVCGDTLEKLHKFLEN